MSRLIQNGTVREKLPKREEISVPQKSSGRATDELGELAGVSRKTYEHAVSIIEDAPKVIADAVRNNELSINAGYEVTKLPYKDQVEIMERIVGGEAANSKTAVRKRNSRKWLE